MRLDFRLLRFAFEAITENTHVYQTVIHITSRFSAIAIAAVDRIMPAPSRPHRNADEHRLPEGLK